VTTMAQDIAWSGGFGDEYADRNPRTPEEIDALYARTYGVTRSGLNEVIVGGLDHGIRVLEVGSGTGVQLTMLQRMGFDRLCGIDISERAVKIAHARTTGINFICSTAIDIPFQDACFGLVFTSGLLIHVHPDNLLAVMREIYRCSARYIWGFEYFAETLTAVSYRGLGNMLWKRDFVRLYLDAFPDLRLRGEVDVPYKDSTDMDCMFLLEKMT